MQLQNETGGKGISCISLEKQEKSMAYLIGFILIPVIWNMYCMVSLERIEIKRSKYYRMTLRTNMMEE